MGRRCVDDEEEEDDNDVDAGDEWLTTEIDEGVFDVDGNRIELDGDDSLCWSVCRNRRSCRRFRSEVGRLVPAFRLMIRFITSRLTFAMSLIDFTIPKCSLEPVVVVVFVDVTVFVVVSSFYRSQKGYKKSETCFRMMIMTCHYFQPVWSLTLSQLQRKERRQRPRQRLKG